MSESSSQTLLIEIGTEELPAGAQRALARALANGLESLLEKQQLSARRINCFSTPRRLAVLAFEIPAAQPRQLIERRGPSLDIAFDDKGRATAAALGFARSAGVAVADLQTLRTPEGAWLQLHRVQPGLPTLEILAARLPRMLSSLPLPRRMRWGNEKAEFLRPVRWLVARLDDRIIPFRVFGLPSSDASFGHRFHHPGTVELTSLADYPDALLSARVVADADERERRIRHAVTALAAEHGAIADAPDALFSEITGMVEWPRVLEASYDPEYLALPEPVLITTLIHHQRFIPLRETSTHRLLPRFIAVLNLESREPEKVRHGLERVVRPRLEDARFHYHRDRKRPFEAYFADLSSLAFAPRLGSMAEKSLRLARLAPRLAEIFSVDAAQLERAAHLCKCDLTTGLVIEFPELQGILGGQYARESGESADVVAAISAQYLPAGPNDPLPDTPCGLALAFADRLDTLIGGFAAGLEPTATKDAFGLRRAAFGLIRIAADSVSPINLEPVLEYAAKLYPQELDTRSSAPALHEFLVERLRSLLLERGAAADVVHAVLAVAPLTPADVVTRIEALTTLRRRPEIIALAAANKRIANILRQAEKQQLSAMDSAPPMAPLEPAEQNLENALLQARMQVESRLKAREYTRALNALIDLYQPLDEFFDSVLVMAPDLAIRSRRLALLSRLRELFLGVADIGKLQQPVAPT